MKAAILTVLVLVVSPHLTFAQIYISDIAYGREIVGEYEHFYVNSFTVTAENEQDIINGFILGTRYPAGDAGAIKLYDTALNFQNQLWSGLDEKLRSQLPEQIIIHNPNYNVTYWGSSAGTEDFWFCETRSPMVPSAGNLFTFNYIPEPATLSILAFSLVMLRKRNHA